MTVDVRGPATITEPHLAWIAGAGVSSAADRYALRSR
jgi:hypothetical protein